MLGLCLLLLSFCEGYIRKCLTLLLLLPYFGFCKNTKSFLFLQIIVLQYSMGDIRFKGSTRIDAPC
jgi:hypothetical protein